MTIQFVPATKRQAKLRMAIVGGPGTGKTFTALAVASALVPEAKVALIDTEHGSASKYAGDPFTFATVSLDSFDPRIGAEAIKAAENAGFDVVVIDSLSHFWMGKDGALEQVDRRSQGNKFTAWREVTPMHTALIEAILQSKAHVIFTMRAKVEYVVETDAKGRAVPRKVGLAPVQREGVEYEADVVGEIDQDHNLRVTKTRCRALTDQVITKPGADLAGVLRAWLSEGAPAPTPIARADGPTQYRASGPDSGAAAGDAAHRGEPVTELAQSVIRETKADAGKDGDRILRDFFKEFGFSGADDFKACGAKEAVVLIQRLQEAVSGKRQPTAV